MEDEIKAAEDAVNAANAQDTGEDNTQVESPTIEETPEDTSEEASEQVETEGEPKKGAQSRIKELAKERDEARLKAQSLADKLAEITGSQQPQGDSPYMPQYQPGEEIDPERLQQDVLKTADAMVTLRIKQNDAVNRINNESRDAIRAFPQLDPESESFDKELSETITEAVEAQVRLNPYSASVKNIVGKLMKPYQRAVDNGVSQATENIAKQVSETALRPTSVRKEEKSASDLSIAELERKLGIVNS